MKEIIKTHVLFHHILLLPIVFVWWESMLQCATGNLVPTSHSLTSWAAWNWPGGSIYTVGISIHYKPECKLLLFGWLCTLESVVIPLWIAKKEKERKERNFLISQSVVQFSKGVTHVTNECVKFWHTSLLFHFHLTKTNENINQHCSGNHVHSSVAIVGGVQIQEFGKS